ncbi:hypothetical protein COV24_04555 [candidate division WWE3 bacterium CG10_big_fil_rev_8_21_14_0_10_32_10]|uniref:DNA polymerase beta n=1 Tax=candidate division WWE3 bacterium CG10_big_fil_rev_8_21_14_0_10_32_10 TaxID=1975090 RepID=A0A2H0R984_UNCKA|nr:MAG: hypothetical protein COV24_04555 [candidate division WWE3 bacterium CG10_big_fil_rev_8_21_14_0_10_32_10]
MINQEVSQIFNNIADYLEMQDSPNFFRIRAFKKAAESVDSYPEDVANLNIYELKKIPGIGDSTAKDILEYAKAGKIAYYEELKKASPVKLEELVRIQGVGPKTVKKLYYKLGVKNIDDLKKAAESGKIATLEGFGEKSQVSILENIKFAIVNKERTRIDIALEIAEKYIEYLKKNDAHIIKINYGGSLRRKNETIGDIDLLVSSKNPKKTSENFVNYPEIEKVLGAGDTKSSVWLKQKIQVDLRVIPVESFGSALQYFTGNKDHNVLLRKIAIKKGYKLSEYGIFKKLTNKKIAGKSEKRLYEKLVNHYIEPELREDEGELDLAINNKLPKLITLENIKGDLQMHTTHSDGTNTMLEMAQKCVDLGYKYMGFTDHFGNLQVANAIQPGEFNKYIDEIEEVRNKFKDKIKILAGGEINIKAGGELDFKQNLLEKLDFVVASIHSGFKMNVEQATNRYLSAFENPVITIIGHPTGRLLTKRPPFEFDYEKVFQEASKNNIVMEINAHPMRLDLSYQLVKIAKKCGCKIQISTDAHSVEELNLMKYGVFVARKAGLEKDDLYEYFDK